MSNDNKIVFTRKFTNILEAEADYIQERRKHIENMDFKELGQRLENLEKPESDG